MSEALATIERPAVVTDEPTITRDINSRRIEARWPLRNFQSPHDGPGVEYAVLSVSHMGSRRAFFAQINRQEQAGGVTGYKPFDAARVGALIPVARFSQKSLEAAFVTALDTLRAEIAAGDAKLESYFTPSEDGAN